MLGIQIVDASGKMVARIAAGPSNVRMLAPGYSLRHGLVGQPFQPERAVQRFNKYAVKHPGVSGDWTYGDRARYETTPRQLTGWEQYGGHARYDTAPRQLTGWDQYGGHASYAPRPGQTLNGAALPMRTVAQDALRSSARGISGLPMRTVAQDALRSSSMHGLDDAMFGPEGGESSELF
jgi:hypothetical protein